MKKEKLFDCYLIGEGNLIIRCADILLSHNCTIHGILSRDHKVKDWTKRHNIKYYNSTGSFYKNIKSTSFEYLISINNYRILPPSVIATPKIFAINYHNAPLPYYGGLHATAWAILNGEKQHGITWHIISELIDGGDILKQCKFPIEEDDTALSLDIKCCEKAAESFKELVEELISGLSSKKPQNLSLRSYYHLHEKPINFGFIEWNSSAEQIYRLWRALNYIGHENTYCSIKFYIQSKVFSVQKVTILNNLSSQKPGLIKKINNTSIEVETNTFDIELSHIIDLGGEEYSIIDLVKEKYCWEGYILPQSNFNTFEQNPKLNLQYAREENKWVNKFQTAKAQILTHVANLATSEKNVINIKFSEKFFSLIKEIAKLYNIGTINALICLISLYFYKINNYENYTLGFIDDRKLQAINPGLFSSCLPFTAHFSPDDMCKEIFANLDPEIKDLLESYGYCEDIWIRYPSLGMSKFHFESVIRLCDTVNNKVQSNIYPLNFYVSENELALYSNAYSESSVQYQLIINMPHHFENLAISILLKKHLKLIDIDYVTKEEYKLLEKWNETKVFLPNELIHQVFSKQANKTPHTIAVKSSEINLTYQELDCISNNFAGYLQSQGVLPNTIVGICMERGAESIISILAILKAGAGYLPIDFNYPPAHINAILSDSKTLFLITSNKIKEMFDGETRAYFSQIKILSFEDSNEKIQKHIYELKELVRDDNCLAYTMYTSGSTGSPKGVMVGHRSIIRLVKNTNYIKFNAGDNVAHAANLGFDASTFEIWGALLNGASLICPACEIIFDAEKFTKFLFNEKINILWLTSALFDQFVNYYPGMFKYIKYLLVGGDVLNPDKIKAVLECPEGRPLYLINGYGPTENTTFTATFEVPEKLLASQTIPIGKPISNTTVYVLDRYRNLMPIGVPGELYTGGEGLALGYLGNPALTAERFIELNINGRSQKVYKTGDQVCWHPQGYLLYLGRIDFQVKIRGFRVEIEEIERWVLKNKSIDQCAVIVQETKQFGKQLICFLTEKPDNKIDIFQLIAFLKKTIPSHHIPNKFIKLSVLPLTNTGKIDRKALSLLDCKPEIYNLNYIPASTSTEKKLENIFCQLLNLEQASKEDDFFLLGGHSLLLAQLIILVKKKFNYNIRLHDFLELPTISHLAQLIETNTSEGTCVKNGNSFLNDVVLPEEIYKNSPASISSLPAVILLTGATGFLGIHLLDDLYKNSSINIYCLIRAKNQYEANLKLLNAIKKYRLNIEINDRIHIMLGDLSLPRVGLTEENFEKLAKEVDVIIHNGAYVHHLYNYSTLRKTNVLSTLELLKLAVKYKTKHFHYISTLAAACSTRDKNGLIEEDFLEPQQYPLEMQDGYTQTKWVSECLLSQVRHYGVPVSIYRPGWIIGDVSTGVCPVDNIHLFLLLKGCLQIGRAPKWHARLNILPVDLLSNLVASTVYKYHTVSQVYNLANPYTLTWVELVSLAKEQGYEVEMVSPENWIEEYLTKISGENALFALLPLYFYNKGTTWISAQDAMSDVNCNNALREFYNLGRKPMKINNKIMKIYFEYFQSIGFLTKPMQHVES